MTVRIVVIDYLKGNLKSVQRGLEDAGAEVLVTSDAAQIADARALVLPGVGAFGDAAATMAALGQDEAIASARKRGAAFLGICLGLHLMFQQGEERTLDPASADEATALPQGLALAPGTCVKLPCTDEAGRLYKVPHVGWNTIEEPRKRSEAAAFRQCALLSGIDPGTYFYFTHSYRAPQCPATVAVTTHSVTFPSVVAVDDRTFGVQFHPEKSSEAGARLLRNFVTILRDLARED